MPLDFPNSPTVNQEFTANGVTWKYDGVAWNIVSGGSGFRVSSGAPSSPALGDLWYESDSGEMFIYYDSQWVSPAVLATVGTSAIGTAQLASSAVTTAKLASSAVTTEKLALGPTYVTSLPSSATVVDGQEIYYAASSASSVIWHLRYRSSNSRWEYLGGPRLESQNLGQESASRTGSAWFSMTSDPALTLPEKGKYIITLRFTQFTTNAGGGRHVASYKIDTSEAVEADGCRADAANATMLAFGYKEEAKTFTSKSTLTMRYLVYDTGTYYTGNRLLAVTPVYLTY